MRNYTDNSCDRAGATPPSAPKWRTLALMIGAALLVACQQEAAPPAKPASPAKPTAAPAATAPDQTVSVTPDAAPVPLSPADINQLLQDARKHLQAERLVAPPGNNALENYSRVLEADPKNQTAQDALRELFPFAVSVAEQNINSGSLDESERIVGLMSKSDPNNNTLAILRGKIEAKRKALDQAQKDKDTAAAAAAAAAAAKKTPGTTAPATSSETPAATAATTTPPPAAAPAPTPAAPVASAPTPPPAPAATGGETRDAKPLSTPAPEYPPSAYRARTEGWVQVAFTVTEQGTVSNVTVTGSNPSRVFDKAAVSAIQRWTFSPKLENGKPVPTQMVRRLEFKAAQ